MVRIALLWYSLFCSLAVAAQVKDSDFCPGAVTPYGGLAFPRVKNTPSKYLELYLPFRERVQISFIGCINKEGKITALKYLSARKHSEDNLRIEMPDSLQIAKVVDLNAFMEYLSQTTFYPAGDWEGKYSFVCKMVLLFEAKPIKRYRNHQNNIWNRRFQLLN
jgi:hypothetical protein